MREEVGMVVGVGSRSRSTRGKVGIGGVTVAHICTKLHVMLQIWNCIIVGKSN